MSIGQVVSVVVSTVAVYYAWKLCREVWNGLKSYFEDADKQGR